MLSNQLRNASSFHVGEVVSIELFYHEFSNSVARSLTCVLHSAGINQSKINFIVGNIDSARRLISCYEPVIGLTYHDMNRPFANELWLCLYSYTTSVLNY